MVARNLQLQAGDEVLTHDHEYGAMYRTWRKLCAEAGASYVRVPIPVPVTTAADFVERVWSAVTPRTRVLFLDHLTSATALIFPVAELCRRARAAGIVSIVDGAHVPGHIPLDLSHLDCDVYTGALHKWLCAPKGCSFLYARREVQSWLDPLVVSWGWESDHPSDSQFVDYHEWQGTRDLSPFLAVAAALDFRESHDWPAVQAESVRLPAAVDVVTLKEQLLDEYRIEVPLPVWNDQKFIRVSFTAHNSEADSDAVVAALRRLLPGQRRRGSAADVEPQHEVVEVLGGTAAGNAERLRSRTCGRRPS